MKNAWLELFDWEFVTATNVALCRECHRLAPFCNFNGNTFAAIGRSLVDRIKLKADLAHVLRTLVGHVVAGTATDAEAKELREFSRSLSAAQLKQR